MNTTFTRNQRMGLRTHIITFKNQKVVIKTLFNGRLHSKANYHRASAIASRLLIPASEITVETMKSCKELPLVVFIALMTMPNTVRIQKVNSEITWVYIC